MSPQWQETPHLTHLHIRLFDFHIKLGLPVAAFSPLDCLWAYNNHSLSVNNSFKPSLLRNRHISATYRCKNLHTYTLCTIFSAQASLVDPLLIYQAIPLSSLRKISNSFTSCTVDPSFLRTLFLVQ